MVAGTAPSARTSASSSAATAQALGVGQAVRHDGRLERDHRPPRPRAPARPPRDATHETRLTPRTSRAAAPRPRRRVAREQPARPPVLDREARADDRPRERALQRLAAQRSRQEARRRTRRRRRSDPRRRPPAAPTRRSRSSRASYSMPPRAPRLKSTKRSRPPASARSVRTRASSRPELQLVLAQEERVDPSRAPRATRRGSPALERVGTGRARRTRPARRARSGHELVAAPRSGIGARWNARALAPRRGDAAGAGETSAWVGRSSRWTTCAAARPRRAATSRSPGGRGRARRRGRRRARRAPRAPGAGSRRPRTLATPAGRPHRRRAAARAYSMAPPGSPMRVRPSGNTMSSTSRLPRTTRSGRHPRRERREARLTRRTSARARAGSTGFDQSAVPLRPTSPTMKRVGGGVARRGSPA